MKFGYLSILYYPCFMLFINMASKGVRRLKICELAQDLSNFFLVGIIIRKQEPRSITLKKDSTEKSVWCFTFRDAPSDYININVWGSTEYITNLHLHFQVGDVVDIIDPKVAFRRIGDYDEKYNPSVTSSFYLTLNEKRSEICLHDNRECLQFLALLRIPTKPLGNFFNLTDIHTNANILCGQNVNLQVAVRNVGELKKVISRNGKELQNREILLMDQTCSALSLQIWDTVYSSIAETWTARKTILFIADARINWNKFRKCAVAVVTNSTIITVDPDTLDAQTLRNYALTVPIQPIAILDNLVNSIRDPATITTIMSCNAVLRKANDLEQTEEFTALIYAIVHQFDIDGVCPVSTLKCLHCNIKIKDGGRICTNNDCISMSGTTHALVEMCYNVRITLTDHTGSLSNCRLSDVITQKMFNCKVTEFEKLSPDIRTQLKWQYLLKPSIARLVILPGNEVRGPLFSAVTIETTSLTEYSSRLPMY